MGGVHGSGLCALSALHVSGGRYLRRGTGRALLSAVSAAVCACGKSGGGWRGAVRGAVAAVGEASHDLGNAAEAQDETRDGRARVELGGGSECHQLHTPPTPTFLRFVNEDAAKAGSSARAVGLRASCSRTAPIPSARYSAGRVVEAFAVRVEVAGAIRFREAKVTSRTRQCSGSASPARCAAARMRGSKAQWAKRA